MTRYRLVMRLRTRYFAAARDAAGLAEETIDVPAGVHTIDDVRTLLLSRHPALGRVLRQSRLALNQRFVVDSDVVDALDGADGELAIIPPVAGG
jgi:molybdopterin synthase sulfur carrier subunit